MEDIIRGVSQSLCVWFCAVLILGGCANNPVHPGLSNAELPRIVPVRQFVANTKYNDNYQLSPDGSKLVYQGVSLLRPAIRWRTLSGSAEEKALRFRKGPPYPFWSADSRYILYGDDPSGREQSHVFAVDTQNPAAKPRDLTPFDGVTAFVHHVPSQTSSIVYISHNWRNKSIFDLYAIDLATGQETLMFENEQQVINMLVGDDGKVRARVRQTEEARLLEVPDGDNWRVLMTAGIFDWINPVELSADAEELYIVSNVDRDKSALISLNLESGEQTLTFAHPEVDLQWVLMSNRDKKPLIAYTEANYPEMHFFDDGLRNRLAPFFKPGENGVSIMSMDRAERMATIVVYDHQGDTYQLVDLDTGQSELLGESAVRKNADVWVRNEPFSFKARDGMTLHGYVSKPDIPNQQPLPTVLLVHGGPWARDGWLNHGQAQFLVNRGYAVLQINYRGSSGYGRNYMFAGAGEFAGKMHTDLIDAIDWAIDKQITDPEKVAIMGGSYGGYAVLVGMTMTPERFQCGIDIVGVSDLALLHETAPPYWKPFMPLWVHFVGDPADPEQRKIMDEKSPVNFAHNVQKPLLILQGANDPRVVRAHSDRMVTALQAAGKEVEYVLVDDEGHGFNHWKHQMTLYRKTEDFLVDCLGGRSGGLDFYQLGSWAF